MRFLLPLSAWLYLAPVIAEASAIHDAAKKGNVDEIAAALSDGANVNESDGIAPPLYYAVRRGHFAAARLLIERGADVNTASALGTPLAAAALKGRAEFVSFLLQKGATPNAMFDGAAPLHFAVRARCLPCVEALLVAGADVNVRTKDGKTALHYARLLGFTELDAYLLDHGVVQPSVPPISGRLANADPVKGRDVFVSNCRDCHTTEENSATRTGPPLWGVVGRAKASLPNVNYSQSLRQWGGTWTFEDLNLFLTAPMAAVPGVKMDFPGLENESARADVIAFLRSRSNDPVPLP